MQQLLAWLITFVWVAMYARKLADPAFPVPAEVTPVMLLAAGFLFGRDIRSKLRGKVAEVAQKADRVLADPNESEEAGAAAQDQA